MDTIISKQTAKNREWYIAISQGNSLYSTVYDQSNDGYYYQFSYPPLIATGEYHNHAVTINGTNHAIFEDSVDISTTDTTVGTYVAMENLSGDVSIGRSLVTSPFYFDGKMTFLAIYPRELDSTEISDLDTYMDGY